MIFPMRKLSNTEAVIDMKTYLRSFDFLGAERESGFFQSLKMTCYNNFYPFQVLQGDFEHIEFEPITILYGGNGSGKSTILNIIAEKLHIQRAVKFNKSSFFNSYVNCCECDILDDVPISKIITSDDVFKNLFIQREKNEVIDKKRNETLDLKGKYCEEGAFRRELNGKNLLENYDVLKDLCDATRLSASKFVKSRVEQNIIGKSNGETALDFFMAETQDAGLYLLDEPENSLSAMYQVELANYLANSARFFDAQLIIATHSPFILSIPQAKIYNLDTEPVSETYDWTSLDNVKVYYDFFKRFADKFEK